MRNIVISIVLVKHFLSRRALVGEDGERVRREALVHEPGEGRANDGRWRAVVRMRDRHPGWHLHFPSPRPCPARQDYAIAVIAGFPTDGDRRALIINFA